MLFEFTPLDIFALGWFLLCWVGYVTIADHTRWHNYSVSAKVNALRHRWMQNMVRRELRMVDILIHTGLLNGTVFFASTSILLVGGLLAVLGATEQAMALLTELPFTAPVSRTAWEIKVLLLTLIFIYAFFKFTWCYRLFSYCSVLLGAASLELSETPENTAFGHYAGRLHELAGWHFNGGLRAYFFALAYLGWFLHPLVFVLSTTWVTYVLWRREFRSRTYRILRGIEPY